MVDTSVSALVVDDVSTMRRILSSLLNKIGIEDVTTVDGPVKALALLEQKKFGLVISDWYMDDMSGLELLGKIRGNPVLQDVPVILMSAESSERNASAAMNAGASGYLVKPFSSDALKAMVMESLELKDSGVITYKTFVLMPRSSPEGYRCHILKNDTEVSASAPNASRQGAIEEAKLWVDQVRTDG